MPTTKKRYTEYLTVELPDGSKKTLRFTSVNRKTAKEKRDAAMRDYAAGVMVFSKKTAVQDYAAKWADQMQLRADDRSRLQRSCIDLIGGLELGQVRATNIRDCYATVAGKSKSLINKTCGVISRMFRCAHADELIPRNPCDLVARPAGTVKDRRSMNELEEAVFLELLQERVRDPRHWYDIALGISYACGLRPGEVRALTRSNIYLDAPQPQICVTQACKDKSREIGPPKTAAGEREVPIPLWFVPLLKAALAIAPPSLWLVPGQDGGCLTYQTYTRRWGYFYREMQRQAGGKLYRNKLVASEIGNDLTPYCLRHTYCTNLACAGVQEVIAMRWMGHDDPNMIRKVYTDASNHKLLTKSTAALNGFNPLR